MNRDEINKHASVRPSLDAWRVARRRAEKVELDQRYGAEARQKARAAATEAERLYDDAVARLLHGEGRRSFARKLYEAHEAKLLELHPARHLIVEWETLSDDEQAPFLAIADRAVELLNPGRAGR